MREDILQALSELIKEKTELKAEKIELGLLDNAEKNIGKIYDDIKAGSVILNKAGAESQNLGKTVILKAEGQLEKIEKAAKMAKELGVDVPKIKEYRNSLKRAIEAGKDLVKKGADAAKL